MIQDFVYDVVLFVRHVYKIHECICYTHSMLLKPAQKMASAERLSVCLRKIAIIFEHGNVSRYIWYRWNQDFPGIVFLLVRLILS